jgi:uncharacterized protein (TIGR02147 family)
VEEEKTIKEYQRFLLQELTSRKSRNQSYSIRAFARDLNVSVTALSEVLSGKRDLSRKNALKVADRLCLSPEITRRLLREIRKTARDELEINDYQSLQEDTFRILSDWYYFAILNLSLIKSNRATPKWIGQRLGISVLEARSGLLLLRRLGFLKIEEGKLVRTSLPLFFNPSTMPTALKKFQHQILNRAHLSIDNDPVDDRYVTSFVLPVDKTKLAPAKKAALNFQKKLMQLLEEGEATEVYAMSFQLFPLTRKGASQ